VWCCSPTAGACIVDALLATAVLLNVNLDAALGW